MPAPEKKKKTNSALWITPVRRRSHHPENPSGTSESCRQTRDVTKETTHLRPSCYITDALRTKMRWEPTCEDTQRSATEVGESTETAKATTATGHRTGQGEQREQGNNKQTPGAKEPAVRLPPVVATQNHVAFLILRSFSCHVKPDLHGNDTSQCAHLCCHSPVSSAVTRLFLRSALHLTDLAHSVHGAFSHE